jgi:hypothetical protein
VQGSKDHEQYFDTLFTAEKMECYSANTLLVAIAREL